MKINKFFAAFISAFLIILTFSGCEEKNVSSFTKDNTESLEEDSSMPSSEIEIIPDDLEESSNSSMAEESSDSTLESKEELSSLESEDLSSELTSSEETPNQISWTPAGNYGSGAAITSESGNSYFAGSSPAQKDALKSIENFSLRYYLCNLSDSELENFIALYKAVSSFKSECKFPHATTVNNATKLIVLAVYECPELMMISTSSGFSMTGSSESNITGVELSYNMTKADYEYKIAEVRNAVSKIADNAAGTDYEKEVYAYRQITQGCTYSTSAADCDNPYGCLVRGNAKCDGISFAMKMVMEKMGIACINIDGTGKNGAHVWNVVNIGGTWYDLDVTNDVNSSLRFYGGFNVSRSWIKNNYQGDANLSQYFSSPATKSMDGSYYCKSGRFIKSGEYYNLLVSDMLSKAYESGERTARVQFESDADYETFLANAAENIEEWMRINGISSTYNTKSLKSFRTCAITIG